MATNRRAWTAAEDKLLRELTISGEPTKNIAATLGRTYAAVSMRRRYLIDKEYEHEINHNNSRDSCGGESVTAVGGGEDKQR
jgi:hypothetical protein